jgi:hypothetical protein
MSQDLASNEVWNIEQAHASLKQIHGLLTDPGFSADGLSVAGLNALRALREAVAEAARLASIVRRG